MPLQKIKKNRGCKATPEQKFHMISFLEKHTDMFINGILDRKKADIWNKLAKEMNALGGDQKSGTKWLKYWYDQRAYVRIRYAEVNRTPRKNAYGHTIKTRELTDYEKRVMALVLASEKKDKFNIESSARADAKCTLYKKRIATDEGIEAPENGANLVENVASESILKKIKLEWNSDDFRSFSDQDYARKCSASDCDILPLPFFPEVDIKTESNSQFNSIPNAFPELDIKINEAPNDQVFEPSPVLTAVNIKSERDPSTIIPQEHYTIFETPANDQVLVPQPILSEINMISETIRASSTSNIPILPVDGENRRTKPIPFFQFSKSPTSMAEIFDLCTKCKTMTNNFDRDIRLETLTVMKAAEQFNREMEIKKYQQEERKIEAINKLIDVLKNGLGSLGQIANLNL